MIVFKKLFLKAADFCRGESGQAVTEYAILLSTVSLAAIVALSLLGTKVQGVYSSAAAECSGNQSFTVSYNGNGGENVPASQSKTPGESLTLSSAQPVRDGFDFLGWAAGPSGTEVSYHPGDSYDADADLTLYALWSEKSLSWSSSVSGTFIGELFYDEVRRVGAEVSMSSSGTDTLSWNCGITLVSSLLMDDRAGFSGVLTIGDQSFTIGQTGNVKKLVSPLIPAANSSGSLEIPGLSSESAGTVSWTLTGQAKVNNSGILYDTESSEQTINVNLSGVLEKD